MFKKIWLGLEIRRLRRQQKKHANALKDLFREVRKFELMPSIVDERDPGILPEGSAEELVALANRFSKDTGISFEMLAAPKISWWDKFMVHPSRIRVAFAEEYQKPVISRVGNLVLLLSYTKRLIPRLEEEYSKI